MIKERSASLLLNPDFFFLLFLCEKLLVSNPFIWSVRAKGLPSGRMRKEDFIQRGES